MRLSREHCSLLAEVSVIVFSLDSAASQHTKTTYFLCWPRPVLLNWRPTVQWSFSQRWLFSDLRQACLNDSNRAYSLVAYPIAGWLSLLDAGTLWQGSWNAGGPFDLHGQNREICTRYLSWQIVLDMIHRGCGAGVASITRGLWFKSDKMQYLGSCWYQYAMHSLTRNTHKIKRIIKSW